MIANNKPTSHNIVKDCIRNIELFNIWISVSFPDRALTFNIDRGIHSLTDHILSEPESKDSAKIKQLNNLINKTILTRKNCTLIKFITVV